MQDTFEVHFINLVYYHVMLCHVTSFVTCSLPFHLKIKKIYLYFKLQAMLRTGLIRTVGKKVASVESDMSSVSLHHVTPIMTVLTAGVLAAILIGTVERLLLRKA